MTPSVDASAIGIGAVHLVINKALTPSQERYAQIEKEMLAIVFRCEWFHDYLYGQREIMVEGDRNPLEAILKNPIYQEPLCLQKMILRIRPYAVNVRYIQYCAKVMQTNKFISTKFPRIFVTPIVLIRAIFRMRICFA